MEPGLRERKKARTMHQVQEVAVRLFTERGFDAVTVEQVAARAEVSPSTLYRYFGTKEGLVVRDEFDDRTIGALVANVRPGIPLVSAMRIAVTAIADEHFRQEQALTMARTRLMLDVPALRAAAGMRVAEVARDLAQHLTVSHGMALPGAMATVGALMGVLLAALYTWYESAGARPLPDCLDEALAALDDLRPTPPSS